MNTRTAFQDAHLRFVDAFANAINLSEHEQEVLLELLTIKLAKLIADKLAREHREGQL